MLLSLQIKRPVSKLTVLLYFDCVSLRKKKAKEPPLNHMTTYNIRMCSATTTPA